MWVGGEVGVGGNEGEGGGGGGVGEAGWGVRRRRVRRGWERVFKAGVEKDFPGSKKGEEGGEHNPIRQERWKFFAEIFNFASFPRADLKGGESIFRPSNKREDRCHRCSYV